MKIAITVCDNQGIESEVNSRFGRAPYIAIIDTETEELEFIDNSARGETGGAGIKAAQTIVDHGVDTLITANLGPKAFSALQAADLKLIKFDNKGTIKEAVDNLDQGNLNEFSSPTNNGHPGTK